VRSVRDYELAESLEIVGEVAGESSGSSIGTVSRCSVGAATLDRRCTTAHTAGEFEPSPSEVMSSGQLAAAASRRAGCAGDRDELEGVRVAKLVRYEATAYAGARGSAPECGGGR
jgi:hypothetical protein